MGTVLDLNQMDGEREFRFSVPAADLTFDDPNFRLVGDVEVEGVSHKDSKGIALEGKIVAPAEVDCSRCLDPIRRDLGIEFKVDFVVPETFAVESEGEVDIADLDTDILDSDRIDLAEVVREQILLNTPEQLFCSADCKGLCPKCGKNRNLIDCKCDEDELDPRWAALKNLREGK